jgi:hypothetical protein
MVHAELEQEERKLKKEGEVVWKVKSIYITCKKEGKRRDRIGGRIKAALNGRRNVECRCCKEGHKW